MSETGTAEPRLRLFVAVELPDTWLQALVAVQDQLRARLGVSGPRLRFVHPDGVHLTLKFLGETPDSRRPTIEDALAAGLADLRPFRLALGEIGSFRNRGSPSVVWVGVAGDTTALASLAGRVEAALSPLGFPTERRAFAAHLTLARVPDPVPAPERGGFDEALRAVRLPSAPEMRVERVSLIQSHLGRGGATYERLSSFPRGAEESRR